MQLNFGGIIAMLAASAGAGWAAEPAAECPPLRRESIDMPDRWDDSYQLPLSPEESRACAETPPGMKLSLWASETSPVNIKAVIAMAFDERGRAWVVESFDYPNEKKEAFEGADRIRILEDRDGDGEADWAATFVEGLNMPSGLVHTVDGVLVAMPPHLVLFKDENGDDVADDPRGRIVYTGFGRKDTHSGISNLRYGLDNWIWGTHGYNGGTINGVKAERGIWRCRSDGSKFEFVSGTSNNTWGLGVREDGQWFNSTANGDHTDHLVVPGKEVARISDHGSGKFHPITDDHNQWDVTGGYTAAANHEIYTARLFPREFWSAVAFVCEPTGHLVHMDFLSPDKSTWTASEDESRYNLYASKDAWSAPIQAWTGPDGAVWILDWYNYLILHNPANPRGPGNAYISPLRDKERSRIYRVFPESQTPAPNLDLSVAGIPELVAALRHPNMHWRLNAQRLLIRRGSNPETLSKLEQLLDDRAVDSAGFGPGPVHAVWTLEGLGALQADPARWAPKLRALLLHPSPAVRRAVLEAMPPTAQSAAAIAGQGRVNDPDPHVRLAALLALAGMPGKDGIAMWSQYVDVDSWSRAAFEDAGIAESGTLPSIPALEKPVAITNPRRFFQERQSLRPNWTLEWEAGRGLAIRRAPQGAPGRVRLWSTDGSLVAEAELSGAALKTQPPLPARRMLLYEIQYRDQVPARGVWTPLPGRFPQ